MQLNKNPNTTMNDKHQPFIEELTAHDLSPSSQYYTLRLGETISRLKIAKVKRITNKDKQDNLPGADFKYIIESDEGKALVVSSWALWRAITAAIDETGLIQTTLELSHLGVNDYRVRVIERK